MRAAPRGAGRGPEPRYLRPGGNRRVRRRRRVRVLLRAVFWCTLWLAGAALATFGFHEGWRLMRDPERFPLRRVVVEGGTHGVAAEVEEALRPLVGANLFTVDLDEAERIAGAHRWVRAARVHRRLPATLHVRLFMRSAAALVRYGDEIRLVAQDGWDLGTYEPRFATESHPVITGVAAAGPEETARRVARGLGAIRRIRSEAPDVAARLSAIDLSREDRIVGTFRDFWTPVLLSPEDPTLNLEHLPAVRNRLEAGAVEAEYIDLRFRDRVAVMLVREGGGTSGA